MARNKAVSRRSRSARRAARTSQIRRDLLRFEGPFDDWARGELSGRRLTVLQVVDRLCLALDSLPGTPRSVTGFTSDELLASLDDLDIGPARDVAAVLQLWTVFLVRTRRWSAGDGEAWIVLGVLRDVITPPEPFLDDERMDRLKAASGRWTDDDAVVAALDATPPVRQAVRLREWFGSRRVASGGLGLDREAAEQVVEHLGDPQVDVLRVLLLWYALRGAGLIRVVDGHVEGTDGGWDGDGSRAAVETRSAVATAFWERTLHGGPEDEQIARAVVRVLVELVDGRVLRADEVRVVSGYDDLADDVLARLEELADDGAVSHEDGTFTVPVALRGTLAGMVEWAARERREEELLRQ